VAVLEGVKAVKKRLVVQLVELQQSVARLQLVHLLREREVVLQMVLLLLLLVAVLMQWVVELLEMAGMQQTVL
jgi:hypothetical protein